MKKKSIGVIAILVMILSLLSACSQSSNKNPLDPEKPITVTIWHYYNSSTKEKFDALVSTFNETIGLEKGIVIDAQSQGDVNQLADAVFDAANQAIGSSPMPDIFASYPDNAYRVSQIVPLIPLNSYFTEEELKAYRDEFLEEGRFITDHTYYILPIAKSSENLYVNETDWSSFANDNDLTEADLQTWEGLYRVSKLYYEQTGKSFFSFDATANFMMAADKQMGEEIFSYNEDGSAKLALTKENAKLIWDYYYVPYIHGYYAKTGRFSSDDAKTGTVLAYTGSTAGAGYFPTEVTTDDQTVYTIKSLVLPYPYFEAGDKIAIQQGAGMCISKSDYAHEYASALFLKWFTDPEQNLDFAVSTGYFPVQNSAIDANKLKEASTKAERINPAIEQSIESSIKMFDSYKLYNSKPFNGSYDMRVFLDADLFDKVTADLSLLNKRVAAGESREKVINELTSETNFEDWFNHLLTEADLIMK
ncbi:MAG: sugar ABC transporter substrate-binding protein [Clostridiales bacterium 38-18]|nr:MAG: sugar ABC transporter substrate-binding protein [Clostridiales bacterium 38-18]